MSKPTTARPAISESSAAMRTFRARGWRQERVRELHLRSLLWERKEVSKTAPQRQEGEVGPSRDAYLRIAAAARNQLWKRYAQLLG
jgi:hypothetical protein